MRPQARGLGPAAAAAAGTQTESSPTNLFLAILPAPSPYGTRAAATRSSLPLPPPPPPGPNISEHAVRTDDADYYFSYAFISHPARTLSGSHGARIERLGLEAVPLETRDL